MQEKEILRVKDVPKNRIVVKDEKGNILFEKTNLVVQRGRIFILERLFNVGINESPTGRDFVINEPSRVLYFFSVGNGGTVGGPFFPAQPTPTDDSLMNRIPFITPPEGTPGVDIATYPLAEVNANGKDNYYGKCFESIEFDIDLIEDGDGVDNLVSMKIMLQVNPSECRNLEINELGLYFAKVNPDKSVEPGSDELFSRITFPSEIMTAQKELYITYTIYA